MSNFTCFSNKLIFSCVLIGLFYTPFLCSQELNSSDQAQNSFWNSVRFGGSLGLNFGNNSFTGIIAPSAIYDFNEVISTGIGLNAAFAKQNEFKTTSLGGSLITLVNPLRFLQLSAEFQELNIHRKYESIGSKIEENYWVPALFAGIGYRTGNVTAGVRYDLLHDKEKSFYGNALMPFVSVYF